MEILLKTVLLNGHIVGLFVCESGSLLLFCFMILARVNLYRFVHQHLTDDRLCWTAGHLWQENSKWI